MHSSTSKKSGTTCAIGVFAACVLVLSAPVSAAAAAASPTAAPPTQQDPTTRPATTTPPPAASVFTPAKPGSGATPKSSNDAGNGK